MTKKLRLSSTPSTAFSPFISAITPLEEDQSKVTAAAPRTPTEWAYTSDTIPSRKPFMAEGTKSSTNSMRFSAVSGV